MLIFEIFRGELLKNLILKNIIDQSWKKIRKKQKCVKYYSKVFRDVRENKKKKEFISNLHKQQVAIFTIYIYYYCSEYTVDYDHDGDEK